MILLDLTKSYDALEKSRSMEILKGYGVGDRVRRLLQEYWDKKTMVARAGGYYGKGFKGEEKTEEEGGDLWRKVVEINT